MIKDDQKKDNISSDSNSSDSPDSHKKRRKQKEIKKEDDLIFGGRFECKKNTILGSGTFGEIYLGIDTMQKEYVAVKLEKPTAKEPQLRNEKIILDMMADIDGFPNVFDYGPYLESTYMAMELLGPSTNALFQHQKHKFTLQSVLLLGIQMIERIQELHNKNYIHRDIKPENFTMGIGAKSSTMYLIDFGLCKKYKDTKTMEHIIYRETREITGTPRYASINNHLGIEQSRRDDLEGIAYVLIYFMKRRLPWQNVDGKTTKERYKKILEKKLSIPTEILCKDIPVEFGMLLNYSRGLRYDERPDYNFLKGMFTNLLFETYNEDFIYDWTLDHPGTEAPNKKVKEGRAMKDKTMGSSNDVLQSQVKATAIFGPESSKDNHKKYMYQKDSEDFDALRMSSSANDSSIANSEGLDHIKQQPKKNNQFKEEDNEEGSSSGTEELNDNDILENDIEEYIKYNSKGSKENTSKITNGTKKVPNPIENQPKISEKLLNVIEEQDDEDYPKK